jgi:NADH:ubiquinone reductase (H+-translocating)
MEKKNVVVLGAGFGGLQAAMRIAKSLRATHLTETYTTILIDRNDAQVYTPVLYEYAAAPEEKALPPRPTFSVRDLIKNLPITFTKGEVTEIDLMNGDIHLATGEEIKAEFLVIALGSEANYFGIKGMQENTIALKTFADAQKTRATLEELLKNNPKPRIVVGGAGANGIELASQIKFLHPQCDVTIVEAMPGILPGLDLKLAAPIALRLAKLGVNVMINSKIMEVTSGNVMLDGGVKASTSGTTGGGQKNIPFDLMVWTGGIKAPDLVSKLPLRAEKGKPVAEMNMGCVAQTPDLKLYPMVYVLGDSVCFYDPVTKRPLPATAPIAMAQAEIVAHNVVEEIKKQANGAYIPATKTYSPMQYPYVIPVGGNWAAAKIGSFVFTGWPARVFKSFVELDYLMSVMPFYKAIAAWL